MKQTTLGVKAKTVALVTSPAIFEIQVAAESTTPVMAGGARTAAAGEVFLRTRRAHLPPLRQTARVVVTARAVQPLARAVLLMTEPDSIGRRVGRRARIGLKGMTYSA